MSDLSLRLRAERKQISEKMRELLTSTSPNAVEQWKQLDAAQEELRKKIEAVEQDGIESSLSGGYDRRGAQLPNIGGERETAGKTNRSYLASPEYRKAFNNFLASGDAAELRVYSPLGPSGSVLIPIGFQKELEVYLKFIGGMRQCARILTTPTGNPLQWPIETDTSNAGHWLAAGAAVNETNPAFSNVTLGADLLSSDLVLVDIELMQDSAFSMEALLAESFGVRLARGTSSAYMNGNGMNIVGLLPALVAAGGRSVPAQGAGFNSGGTGAGNSAGTSLGTEDWSNAITAVDQAYRIGKNVGFMGAPSTFDAMRNVLDKYGRPIWQTSLAQGESDTILGFPYWKDAAMPAIGVNNTPVIFGNFEKYIIREVLNMTMVRYAELFMQNHQLGFECFLRTYGQLLNPLAFSYILNGAS